MGHTSPSFQPQAPLFNWKNVTLPGKLVSDVESFYLWEGRHRQDSNFMSLWLRSLECSLCLSACHNKVLSHRGVWKGTSLAGPALLLCHLPVFFADLTQAEFSGLFSFIPSLGFLQSNDLLKLKGNTNLQGDLLTAVFLGRIRLGMCLREVYEL